MQQTLDLADFHKMVGKTFKQISAEEAWDMYALSDDQVAFFHENGFLSGIELLDTDQVDQMLEELERITKVDHPAHGLFYEFHSNESSDPNAVLLHALGHWRLSTAFHDVLWNPRFVVAASQLLGNKAVRFWHDQLFCKPAHHGGVVAWHQDYSYWTRTIPMQHLTCWIGLDDASEENGCLQYIPGSHRWSLLDKPELAGDMNGLEHYLTEEQKIDFKKKVPAILPKGYGTFHHPLIVHGSYENRSDQARRAFVLNVFADGTISNSDETLLRGVPIISKGNKMDGKFFPLLYSPPAAQTNES